jgi:hypothetical protein
MGAWGYGNFENDAALDFVAMVQSDGIQFMYDIIEKVADLEEEEYIESDDACMALAAIEYVVASKGNPAPDLREDIVEWIVQNEFLAEDLVLPIALKAVNRILTNSELRDLWFEGGDAYAKDWLISVNNLKERIALTISDLSS